jgi:Family of unknown function (DUF5764)
LLSIITPLVIEGIKSIFDESIKVCKENNEMSKYLMTFQLFLSRVPKWNMLIIEDERKRIIERSGCNYLEDLIACVHIIQLKVLTCTRVGNRQKQSHRQQKIADFLGSTKSRSDWDTAGWSSSLPRQEFFLLPLSEANVTRHTATVS